MCGIAGVLRLDNTAPDPAGVNAMLDVMSHRGPDDRDVRSFGSLVLGHLRLSIIAPSPEGRQPMADVNGRAWIAYNGELYNYLELRREQRDKGARFATETDTEVFLSTLLDFGPDVMNRFNGMWAAAVWEPAQRRLLLCRDRMGIKPLYWYRDADHFVFASEVKGVLAWMLSVGKQPELAEDSVQTYISTGLVDGLEETFFKGVHRFPAAHYLEIIDGNIGPFQCWWNLEERAAELREERGDCSGESAVEELRFLLDDALKLHSRSDVPVGVCLSGGLDSSAVAAHASSHIPGLHTFTSAFPEGEEWNETEHAEAVNTHFGLSGHTRMVDGACLIDTLPDILWYLDEPSLALGVFPQWHVMQLAAERVTVVLDGQGGDELFGGYDPYIAIYLYSLLQAGDLLKYREILRGFHGNYGQGRAMMLGREVKDIYRAGNRAGAPEGATELLNARLHLELTKTRLPALLRYEDRLSMAFSMESRVPLLDYRLTEFALSLPESLKIGPGWSKYMLRLGLDSTLPDSIVWRKDKKGFPTPLMEWMQGAMGPEIINTIKTSGLVVEFAGQITSDQERGWLAGNGSQWHLWRRICLATWEQSYLSRLASEMRSPSPIRRRYES
ncbi:asparagine synthase (glutamine-hydrolyzing) [Pseudodesulfovibrio sediminis]|uniref:asparagine synthase (glutamine-hydrolyzing) n=1 Tax=Pseudodesulfovibrio sediminis TaxID=2810563 RepID=A0ABN6EVH7_9BACT|nr:asparagine synthase (glutamine-hydrolyzing) [Pseudodesulfovibrio sediminis]BCS89189.1 asparagine synthetase B [Pseudodesulfovibrio sediminis]